MAGIHSIDHYKRTQDNFSISDLYPDKKNGLCGCGCGKELKGRRTRWATDRCSRESAIKFFIIKGHASTIRHELKKRDKGVCAKCKTQGNRWDADHIKAVCCGGGGCTLDNFQTLCKDCHKQKTKSDMTTLRKQKVSKEKKDSKKTKKNLQSKK